MAKTLRKSVPTSDPFIDRSPPDETDPVEPHSAVHGPSDPELAIVAREKHALNVQIREWDWLRSIEAVHQLQDPEINSVSDIVRLALDQFLDTMKDADEIAELALMALRFDVEERKMREDKKRMLEEKRRGIDQAKSQESSESQVRSTNA